MKLKYARDCGNAVDLAAVKTWHSTWRIPPRRQFTLRQRRQHFIHNQHRHHSHPQCLKKCRTSSPSSRSAAARMPPVR